MQYHAKMWATYLHDNLLGTVDCTSSSPSSGTTGGEVRSAIHAQDNKAVLERMAWCSNMHKIMIQ